MEKKTKTVKNIFKPVYTVDIRDCESTFDVALAFAKAKFDAGVALNQNDLDALIEYNIDKFVDDLLVNTLIVINRCESKKKPNIFKRFWNWLTNKK